MICSGTGAGVRDAIHAATALLQHAERIISDETAPEEIPEYTQYVDPRYAEQLMADAQAVQQSGAFSLVLECIPAELARIITGQLRIPTIGIGAGPHCDGQVLVIQDLLGMNREFRPKFVKRYASLHETIKAAVDAYAKEVRGGAFPADEHCFKN
ncbi:MAG: hypothetical protein HGB17_16600 [Syntrophobacteraceae bacterium]|nr:hypothetical protein [Syntrophobacteraceae bacterium]